METTINFHKNRSFLVGLLCFIVIMSHFQGFAQSKKPDAFEQNKLLGKGGNLGNILYHFDTWNKEQEMEELDLIKSIGLNSVRINVGPFAHVGKAPTYSLSKAFFDRLDWTVNQSLKRGLAVIIDQHEYHAMADDPMGNNPMFLACWKQMAEHYKNYPSNVFFGVLNEPNGNLTPYLWNYLLPEALKVIRASNPNRTLVIGPGNWNGIKSLEALTLPEDDRNIIVEIHYYSPHHFTHQGASWSKGSEAWLGMTWKGSPEEQEAVVKDFKIAIDWAEKHKRPLYLGEFGVYYKADMESRVQWLTFVVQHVEKNNITWAIWDTMGTGFGIYDNAKKEWIKPLKDAILPPGK